MFASPPVRCFGILHDRITDWGFSGAAAAVGVIGLSSCYEVVARYLFGAPTTWAYDATGYLFCAAIFLAAPQLSRTGGHVAITLLSDTVSPSVRRILDPCIKFAGLCACAFIAWIALGETMRQFDRGIETLAVRPIPKWIVSSFIVYGMASSALHFLRQFLGSFRGRAPSAQES